ncbi:MAG: hypothetical protein QGG14_08390 [Planctomycetota bacterium]|nr:hypothetical protein [Planctomycetota bacterium]
MDGSSVRLRDPRPRLVAASVEEKHLVTLLQTHDPQQVVGQVLAQLDSAGVWEVRVVISGCHVSEIAR